MSEKVKAPRALTRWVLWCGQCQAVLGGSHQTRAGAREAKKLMDGPHGKTGRIVKLRPEAWS
jgi:hypothetical protein